MFKRLRLRLDQEKTSTITNLDEPQESFYPGYLSFLMFFSGEGHQENVDPPVKRARFELGEQKK